MVSIYFLLCDNGDVPSGWTEISATYQGRLLKKASSGLLATAGTDTHTHTVTTKVALASGGATNSATSTYGSDNIITANHSHTASSADQSVDAGTETSLPYYKNYRMIYKNISEFTGVVPAGAAVLMEALPSAPTPDYDHWAYDENDSCYIRIASSYGGYGGADNHIHPLTVAWNLASVSAATRTSGGVSFVKGATFHTHDPTGMQTDSTAHTYRWIGAGVSKAITATACLPAGSIAWFDGTIPSGWTAISSSYNNYFVKNMGSANRTLQTGGTDGTHTHTATGNSGGSTGTSQTAGGGSSAAVLYAHTHAMAGGVFSAVLPVPSNFTLAMASNDEDIVPMQTRTKTYSMDLVLKSIGFKSYTSDLLIKKLGINKSYAMDLLTRKNGITKSINADILIKKTCVQSFYADILLKKFDINKIYQLDILLAKGFSKTYQANILLRKEIVRSYTMNLLLKKTYIESYIFDLLIKRLGIKKNYAMDLLIKKCNITKSIDVSVLISKSFTKVYNIDILLRGLNNKYYYMDIILARRYSKVYQIDIMIFKEGVMKDYSMDILLTSLTKVLYQVDILIKKYNINKVYQMNIAILRREIARDYALDILIINRLKSTYEMNLLVKEVNNRIYQMDIVLQRNNINKAYQMDLLLSNNNINKIYQMSMHLYKVGIKSYQANLLLYKTSTIRYTLGIKIISYGLYHKKRDLSLDDIQPKITVQKEFDKYTFDPIVDQLKRKDDIGKGTQQVIEINRGFDEYVFDPMIEQLRRKRNL